MKLGKECRGCHIVKPQWNLSAYLRGQERRRLLEFSFFRSHLTEGTELENERKRKPPRKHARTRPHGVRSAAAIYPVRLKEIHVLPPLSPQNRERLRTRSIPRPVTWRVLTWVCSDFWALGAEGRTRSPEDRIEAKGGHPCGPGPFSQLHWALESSVLPYTGDEGAQRKGKGNFLPTTHEMSELLQYVSHRMEQVGKLGKGWMALLSASILWSKF